MYSYIKCPTCNNEIGSIYKLFAEMRKIKIIENKEDNMLDIFELLNVQNYCCRNRLTNVRDFNQFLHSDNY